MGEGGDGGGERKKFRQLHSEADADDTHGGGGGGPTTTSGAVPLSSDGRLLARSKSKGHKYHYFDNDEPRPGAHSFDGTYHIYRVMEKATRGRLSLEPNPSRGPKPRPLNLEKVLRDLHPEKMEMVQEMEKEEEENAAGDGRGLEDDGVEGGEDGAGEGGGGEDVVGAVEDGAGEDGGDAGVAW